MGTRTSPGSRTRGIERRKERQAQASHLHQARALSPDKLERSADSPVQSEMWHMAAYQANGDLYYKRELIDEKYNESMYEIHIIGRSKPKPAQIEKARRESAAILAAYEHAGEKLPKKKRERLTALAEGNTAEAMYSIKDNRRVGATEIPKVKRESSTSAAADDLRAMGEENRLYLGRVKGHKEGGSRKPFPTFKPSRLEKAA